jgi:UPF0755 protein
MNQPQDTSALEKMEASIESIENQINNDESSWNRTTNRRTLLVVGVLAAAISAFYAFVSIAPSDFPENKLINIPDGSTLTGAALMLEREHVIQSAWWFKLLLQARGKSQKLYAGDYVFKERLSFFQVADRVTSGAFGLEPVKFVVPEGATVKEIAKILDKKLLHFSPTVFIEEGEKFEGYLFPDTYHVLPNIKELDVLRVMKDTLTKRLEPYQQQLSKSKFTLHEILTIASILEKEESDRKDRKMISGIIYNRLAKNMPLQVDATFLYILGRGTFGLSREDLKHQSPYNTYMHSGLPPGPINNPGVQTIDAVLNPTPNPYIFYLADNAGTTYYSKTYEEHLAYKRQYIDGQPH